MLINVCAFRLPWRPERCVKIRDLKNRLSFALICVHLISRSGSINITSCTIMFPSGGKSKVALVRSVSDVSNFDAFVPNGSTFTCLSSLSRAHLHFQAESWVAMPWTSTLPSRPCTGISERSLIGHSNHCPILGAIRAGMGVQAKKKSVRIPPGIKKPLKLR